MPSNFKQFSRELKQEQDDIFGVRFPAFKREVVSELVKRVVPRTPVRFGISRANWVIGIGAPPTAFIRTPDPTGAATIAAALTIIASVKRGVDVFFVNNAPWISFLENGSSRQASRGMLAISLAEVDMQFRSVE